MHPHRLRRRVSLVGLSAVAALSLSAPLLPASATTPSPVGGASGAAEAATAAKPGPTVPTLVWTDCGAPYECATAVVPRDYDRPTGPTFELAVVRHRAPDQANRIGTIFANPGGPGVSGVAFVKDAPPGAWNLFSRFDVVSWDPRGIGASTPGLDCTTDDEDTAFTSFAFPRPENADRDQLVREARDSGRACEQRNPDVLQYLSTANTARDLDLLRQAVGDEKLTYVGISHGSHIGGTYSSLFPDKVRGMVIDAPIDLDAWVNRPTEVQRERATAFESELSRFFMLCVAAGDACGFGGDEPDEAFDALVAQMNATPMPAPSSASGTPMSGDDLLYLAAAEMYSSRAWAGLAEGLVQATTGDASLLRDDLDAELGRAPDGSLPPSGAFVGTTAQDWQYDRRAQDSMDEGYHADVYAPRMFHVSQGYDMRYVTWPVKQHDNFTGPWTYPADAAPALVIGVTHDASTPYKHAQRYVDQLGNAQLMTYDADRHTALTDLNFCIVAPVIDYLTTLTLPPAGTTCEQEYEPFPDPAALTSRAQQTPEWELPRAATSIGALQ